MASTSSATLPKSASRFSSSPVVKLCQLLCGVATVRDDVVYGCQTSPHLRLASQLSHHHQVSCGGLWASQDFPLPTGVRLLCQAATLLGPALTRGLCIVFILVEPFCAPFSLRCCEVRGSAGTGGAFQLQCYNLGYLDTKPASSRRSSSRSCGGLWASSLKVVKGSPPPSGGLVPCIVIVTQTLALHLLS